MKILLFALCLSLLPASGFSLEPVSREVYVMGTRCSLTVLSGNRKQSLNQLERLIRGLEDTEKELSTWQKNSMLSDLNRQPVGTPFQAEASLYRLLSELQLWTRETDGAFDPGIGALIRAWGIRSAGRIPSDFEVMQALDRSGMRLLEFDSSNYRITRTADVIFDCGAFGKGEAIDRIRSLDSTNQFSWLVNLGGQVAVQGLPPDPRGWEVNIAHPRHRDKPALSVYLTSGSLATSGGSERDMNVSGNKIGHILDPRTGRPVLFTGSVSVWHESALIADILSTALYAMGPDKGLRWADDRGFAACYLLESQGGIKPEVTRAFREHFMSNQNKGIPNNRGSDGLQP